MPHTFRKSLKDPETFTVTYELVPGRSTRRREFKKIMRFVEEAAKDRRLDGVSITENAGGHPALAPEVLGREIKARGLEPILHFSCKDKNRNQIESTLLPTTGRASTTSSSSPGTTPVSVSWARPSRSLISTRSSS